MAIFHSHGHIDHFGCTQRFQELSGAKTYISRIDNDIVNGRYDLSWAKELAYERLPFDLVMGNHPPQNDTEGKLKKLLSGQGGIVDPSEWKRFLIQREQMLDELIAKEMKLV